MFKNHLVALLLLITFMSVNVFAVIESQAKPIISNSGSDYIINTEIVSVNRITVHNLEIHAVFLSLNKHFTHSKIKEI